MPENKLEEIIIKQDITEVIARYFFCLDEKNTSTKEMRNFFTDNASVKMPTVRKATGIENIAEVHRLMLSQFEFVHHVLGVLLFTFHPNGEVEVKCQASALYKNKSADLKNIFSSERLVCVARKCDDNQWRICYLDVQFLNKLEI